MADEGSPAVDLWSVMDEAEQTVNAWPAWQQRYDADVFHDESASVDESLDKLSRG